MNEYWKLITKRMTNVNSVQQDTH